MSNLTLSNGEKLSVLRNLAIMLGAGIPIMEAVDSLIEDTSGNQKKVLNALRADLMQGKQVSASLANFPRVFDRVTINLIKAAEEAGTLETTLEDLRDHIQKDIEFLDKVKFAMIYPSLILVVFAAVFIMILTVVVPKIASVFSRLKVELPLPTRILIVMSNIAVNNTLLLLLVIFLIVSGLVLLYRLKREFIMNIFYSFPVISGLIKQIDYARFSRSLYLLLNSGLPITVALALSQEVVLNRNIKKLLIGCREMVIQGKKLSDGLRLQKKLVPSVMIKLIEAGERSGTLDKSMQELAVNLDYEVSNALKAATALLEPILLVLVGISVGGMMLAIIAPIYSMIGQVGGGGG